MIDTHTHLYYDEDYPDGGGEAAVDRALAAGVSHVILPNVGVGSVEPLLKLHHARPDVTSVAPGLHPEEVDADWRPKMTDIFAAFEGEVPVAVGEVGVDLYHDPTWKTTQMDAFGEQLDLARGMNLPVIIHCREALDEVLHVIGLMGAEALPPLVFHSFTADPEEARRILELPRTALGINGVVTFKNAPLLRDAVREAGIGRIVLETDSPYLAPVPRRGRTNESSYLPHVLHKVAELCGLTPEEAEHITDRNALSIFSRCTSLRNS